MGSNPTPGATTTAIPVDSELTLDEDERYLKVIKLATLVTFAGGAIPLALGVTMNCLDSISVRETYVITLPS